MALYNTDMKDVREARKSGYTYAGKEIVLGRRRGRPPTYGKNPTWFSQDRKVEAATLYAVYGAVEEVEKLTNIPVKFLREWKLEPWWLEIQRQVYIDQNVHLASKLSKTLDLTLEHLTDRLVNGDIKFNRNTGEAERVPVDAKTLATLLNNVSHQRSVVRGEPTSISASQTIDDRLKGLQDAFLKFSKMKEINAEATVVETIEECNKAA